MQYVVFIQCFSFSVIFYPFFHIIMHDINEIINSEFRTIGIFAISFRYRSKDMNENMFCIFTMCHYSAGLFFVKNTTFTCSKCCKVDSNQDKKNFCFLPGNSGDTQLSRYLNYTRKILTVTVQQLSEKKRQYSDVSS